jgi:hypothetical protein
VISTDIRAGPQIWTNARRPNFDESASTITRPQAIAESRARLDQLNEITRSNGRPYPPTRPLDEVVEELPADWCRGWQ